MKLLLENWRKYLDECEKFPDITSDQSEIQQSLDYFYKEHAPSKGERSEVGRWEGYNLVYFDIGAGEAFYFLVDDADVPKAYVALNPLADGMQVGNVRKTTGGFRVTELYKWLIDQYGILYSDSKQTTAGQKIWTRLKDDPELNIEEGDLPGGACWRGSWRQHLKEENGASYQQQWATWLKEIENSKASFVDHMVGHGAKAPFIEFDDSRIGAHTAGHKKYSLDRYFGHMFANNKKLLHMHTGADALGSNYVLTVKISPGNVAVIRIDDFMKFFKKNTPDVEARIKQFKKWLIKLGFNGIWWRQPGKATNDGLPALISNSIQIFKGADAEVLAIRDLKTDTTVWKKEEKGNGSKIVTEDGTGAYTPAAPSAPRVPPRLEEIMEERGFYVNRFIDEGKYGKVWELEGSNTGRRTAMKIVSVLLAGQQIDREESNYRWILENRPSLPQNVKEHLVDVYSVDRIAGEDLVDRNGHPYQYAEGALIVIMELLAPAPENVVDQILGHSDEYVLPDKEARILKDEGAVYELIQNLVMRIDGYMAAAVDGYSPQDAQTLIKKAHRAFLAGDTSLALKNTYVDYSELEYIGYTNPATGEHYPPVSDERKRLLNVLFNLVDRAVPENEYRESIIQSAAKELDDKAHYYLNKQVVPIHQGEPSWSEYGGADKYTQQAFPEAAPLMKAMEYLFGERWQPKDIHHKNVMLRPSTNQLVLVDVGLFKSL